uniref:Uncharacterized protein n=2 Tax=Opuntia streptacantha TaxID=393608 RepID=A0A7C9EKT5_OPUST
MFNSLGKPIVNGIARSAMPLEKFFIVLAKGFPSKPSCMLHSTVIKKDNDAKTGKRHKLSGVVRSVNHSVPPVLKDGTFSTMFEIAKKKLMNIGPWIRSPFSGVNGPTPYSLNKAFISF